MFLSVSRIEGGNGLDYTVNTAVKTADNNTAETQAFNREEWLRQKNAERESAYRMMDEMADLIKTRTGDLRNFLDLMIQFPRHSVGNLMLIAAQMPDATDLREFNEWKGLGTSIKKGQTGIMLLEPGKEFTRSDGTSGMRYNVKRVFDIKQTRALSNPPVPFLFLPQPLLAALYNDPVCGVEVDGTMTGTKGDDAVYDPEKGVIRVAKVSRMSNLIVPLARETAKAYLCSGDSVPEHADEMALCVSYVFCKRKGADVSNIDLSAVKDGIKDLNPRQIRRMMDKVKDVASAMREQMNRYFREQKEQREAQQEKEAESELEI